MRKRDPFPLTAADVARIRCIRRVWIGQHDLHYANRIAESVLKRALKVASLATRHHMQFYAVEQGVLREMAKRCGDAARKTKA